MNLFRRAKAFFQPGRLDVGARFERLREAVHGTMSSFFVVRDRQSGELFGLKLLDPEKTRAFEARFKGLKKPSEGEITAKINHPRVVRVYEHGQTTDGRIYLLMELVDGAGLNTFILNRDSRLVGRRVPIIRQMFEAVGAVHAAGFIHRDVCPRNFILSPDLDSVKLIDFGLAVPATAEFMAPGNRTGTPSYMAPEIVRRRKTDHRVDIFALGVTAYQLLTYRLPWPEHDATGKAAMMHDTIAPEPIRDVRPKLNLRLAETVMACMAIDPEDRPRTTDEVLQALRLVRGEELA